MKILIFNQPINNHGDEAAHKAFVRSLAIKYPQHQYTVLFFHVSLASVDAMNVHLPNVTYVNTSKGTGKKKYSIIKSAFKLHIGKLLSLLPQFAEVNSYIKNSDCIICAPGGICMGTFRNWEHVYFLKLAQWANKPIAYYSRSFGPFTGETQEDKIFNSLSIELLNSFRFLSIRDRKTMDLADKLHLNYTPAIDTAFLNNTNENIPDRLKDKSYSVFVPNSLTWHPTFANCDAIAIEQFYTKLIERILLEYQSDDIIMLPQLFNKKDGGDFRYFTKIHSYLSQELQNRVLIFPETTASDLQQAIIGHSRFIIGARYHSVVFGINNEVPFVSLSYEHKMYGLLNILGLDDYSIPFDSLVLNDKLDYSVIDSIIDKTKNTSSISKATYKAQTIAKLCENELVNALNIN